MNLTVQIPDDVAVCGCGVDETTGRKAIDVDPQIKASSLKRLRRIEGQVRCIQKWLKRIGTVPTS